MSLKVYIELRKRFSLRSCQIWNTQKESQKFLARSMQTQLSACGNNEHGTFTEKEKQHTNICHFFKQTNGDLRQIFTDRNNCSILPSPNELKNVLSVCAFDSIKWNVYLTRLEKRLFPDCSEFASRCYRYVCDQLTTIEAVVDVFEFIKRSWPGNNKILDRLADRLIDKKILASTLFSSTVHEPMQVVRG